MSEKTLSLIKPDAVERNLIGKIIQIFEENDLKIDQMKKIHVDVEFAKNFMLFILQSHFLKIFVITLVLAHWLLWF